MSESSKISWTGILAAIQPRIKLLRSFDQRSHSYLGYVLYLQGQIGGEERYFSVAIGDVTQEKFQFQAGDEISGESVPVTDPKSEVAEQYKASQFGFPTGK